MLGFMLARLLLNGPESWNYLAVLSIVENIDGEDFSDASFIGSMVRSQLSKGI